MVSGRRNYTPPVSTLEAWEIRHYDVTIGVESSTKPRPHLVPFFLIRQIRGAPPSTSRVKRKTIVTPDATRRNILLGQCHGA